MSSSSAVLTFFFPCPYFSTPYEEGLANPRESGENEHLQNYIPVCRWVSQLKRGKFFILKYHSSRGREHQRDRQSPSWEVTEEKRLWLSYYQLHHPPLPPPFVCIRPPTWPFNRQSISPWSHSTTINHQPTTTFH